MAVLTAFGAAKTEEGGKSLRTYHPGLHHERPWERAHDIPMMEQALELAGEKGGQTAMPGDGTLLRFDSTLRYLPMRVAQQVFDTLSAQLKRATAEVEEEGRQRVALLDARTSAQVAERVAEARGQDPAAVGRAFAKLERQPRVLVQRARRAARARPG